MGIGRMDTQLNDTLKTWVNVPFEEAVDQVTVALKNEGFGVLTQIDVQATLKKKMDVDFTKYVIIGACNPPLAYRALQAEKEVGLLLPCNVIVYEHDGSSMISIVDPLLMLGVIDNKDLEKVALEVKERLEKVIEALRK